MKQDTKQTSGSLKEKLIIIIMISSVFVGIYLALISWLKMQDSDWLNNRKEQRILQIQTLATNADCDYFKTRKILPLLRHICEDPQISINATRENFLNKYDLDLSIYKFDKTILKETAPENAGNKWLMKNLFQALLETDIKKIEAKQKELDKKIEFAFGYGKTLTSIKNNPEMIINSVVDGRESFSAWSIRGDKGVIICCNRPPDKEKILNETIKLLKPLPNQISAGKLNFQLSIPNSQPDNNFVIASRRRGNPVLSSQLSTLNSQPSILNSQLSSLQAYNYLSQYSKEHGIFDNKEWYFTTTNNNDKYYTAYEISNSSYNKAINYFNIIFLIIIVLTIIIIINYSNTSILNLKKLVTLIFIASSILPLTITGTSSLESIDTLISINKNEMSSSVEEAIGNIIQNFGNYLISCSDELESIVTPSEEGFKNKESLEKLSQKITDKFPNARVTARNAAANKIYTNTVAYSPGQETLFKSISYRYIEKFNKERTKELEYSGNPFSDSLVKQEDLAFSSVCNYPDQLQFIRIGGYPISVFVKTYQAKYGEMALLEVQPQIKHLINNYTKSINRRNLVAKQQYINLAVFNPLRFKWLIPPKEYTNNLFEQAKTAYVLNKTLFRQINHKNKQIYSFCIPNSTYENVCFIGYLSTELFDKKISRLRMYVFTGAIVAIILLLAIISWLMKQIIAPLGSLETGIKALSEHKYEVKIPVPEGKDELTTLFKEFNFMMGENYDMQMAKNVQEGLLTTKFPEIQNYYINGFSIAAGDLGGDCLTSFQMPDKKILFLVGDLTGHGIGSALMMSFVRSVTFNWSQNPKDSPSSLADSIDRMLRDNQMEHMFMGIICGILDPESGRICFITRGHIYPLFLRNDDTSEWLGSPALPLGIGKRHESIEQTTVLLPGERLLCISDGFIEIHKDDGMTITYEQVESWAKENKNIENSQWLKSIEQKYHDWCEEHKAVQTDDITLFTIIREWKVER